MRLMMTTDVVGGVWTYTQELVEGMIHEGHEVVLVSLGRAPSDEQRLWAVRLSQAAAERFRYIATDFKLEWMPDGPQDLQRSAEFLLRVMDDEGPDIFHSNQFCYGSLPCAIPKVVVAHSDVVSWWHARYAAAPPVDSWFEQYRSTVANGLECASAVVAPSAWMRRQLRAHYGLNVARCRVIPNGRSLPASPFEPRRMQAVSVGRLWDEAKNLALLLKAPIDLPVFVAGEHSVSDGGLSHAPASSQREANRQLCLMGALESGQVRTLMRESAMYIATSLYEPFGLAPLEAALAGCALVLSDIPSFHDVWAEAAVFFDPHDPQALACAVHRLAADQRQLRRIAAASQARAIQLYAAETMIARYLHLYATVQPPAQEDAFVA